MVRVSAMSAELAGEDNGEAAPRVVSTNNLDPHLNPPPIRPRTADRQSNGYRMKIQ